MGELGQLRFGRDKESELLLPEQFGIDVSCYDQEEVRQAIAETVNQIFSTLTLLGFDLRALDGITLAHNCEAAAASLQRLPDGLVPLESTDPPGTMEMGRTVAVWRDQKLRFHIVLGAGVGLMMLSTETILQTLAYGCIAHEAAHVEHEGHLYRAFPDIYGRPLDCGERSRQTFLKAMDVWSEYAASRSSASFRPEALWEFEGVFCRALESSFTTSKDQIAAYRRDRNAPLAFREIQQIFGDIFISAGYFLGHLDGLEFKLEDDGSDASVLLRQHPQIERLVFRLRRILNELWLGECGWESIEVFAPIYEVIQEMMALHGLAFAKHEKEWRIVMCEEAHSAEEIRDALTNWMTRPSNTET
jgi:hypothetical protein